MTTPRRRIPERERLAIFGKHEGRCHICGDKINSGQAWDVEHIIPLGLGGSDDQDNLAPAHVNCHKGKTATDHGAIAKAKRMRKRQMGIRKEPRNPLNGGRRSKFKKKVNGEVVEREKEET